MISKFGQAHVNLGELYFGFGDYEHAITVIQSPHLIFCLTYIIPTSGA